MSDDASPRPASRGMVDSGFHRSGDQGAIPMALRCPDACGRIEVSSPENRGERSSLAVGDHLWSKQREIVEAVAKHRRVAVQSCHDIGKSFCAATAVAWWLSCWPPGEAFVVTTARTDRSPRSLSIWTYGDYARSFTTSPARWRWSAIMSSYQISTVCPRR
jgi:hypothetical protein